METKFEILGLEDKKIYISCSAIIEKMSSHKIATS